MEMEIKKAREEVWNSVKGLTNAQLNEVVEEGKWSIAQVLEHLHLMEENVVRLIHHALNQSEFEEPGSFPVQMVADRTKKVTAPEILNPSNKFQTLEELKMKLSQSRDSLEKVIQNLSEDDLKRTMKHRRFGVLSIKQWISLVGYHELRHIGQIEEIKKELVETV